MSLPGFDEDYGPETVEDGEGEGVLGEDEVCPGSDARGDSKEREIGLEECEIECNLPLLLDVSFRVQVLCRAAE